MLLHQPDLRLAWYVAEWLIRLGALAVVPLRRSPAAIASWLLLIFFFPVAGLALYLAIGRPSLPAARERRWRALHPFYAELPSGLRQQAGAMEVRSRASPTRSAACPVLAATAWS